MMLMLTKSAHCCVRCPCKLRFCWLESGRSFCEISGSTRVDPRFKYLWENGHDRFSGVTELGYSATGHRACGLRLRPRILLCV